MIRPFGSARRLPANRLVVYERAPFQFPCYRLRCAFVYLLASARLGAHGIVREFGGLYLVKQGSLSLSSVHLPLRTSLLFTLEPHRATACPTSSKGNHGDGTRRSSSPSDGGSSLGSKSRRSYLALDNLLLLVVCCFLLLVSG